MPLEDESSKIGTTFILSQQTKSDFVSEYNKHQLKLCNEQYVELLTELFFLQHDGNYIDFIQFKKRPSHQLLRHIDQNPIHNNGNYKSNLIIDKDNHVKTQNLSHPDFVTVSFF